MLKIETDGNPGNVGPRIGDKGKKKKEMEEIKILE